MNIYQTIKSLYAVMCAAKEICKVESKETATLSSCLSCISDEDVDKSLSDLAWVLKELADLDNKIKNLYILKYKTSNDKENKNVILTTECVFGDRVITFSTRFDQKAAQSLIEALNMSLAMAKAGDRLSAEGNA